MKEYNGILVSCKRICINPCAEDEYEIKILPQNSEPIYLTTFAGIFETDESICDRMYKKWINNNK